MLSIRIFMSPVVRLMVSPKRQTIGWRPKRNDHVNFQTAYCKWKKNVYDNQTLCLVVSHPTTTICPHPLHLSGQSRTCRQSSPFFHSIWFLEKSEKEMFECYWYNTDLFWEKDLLKHILKFKDVKQMNDEWNEKYVIYTCSHQLSILTRSPPLALHSSLLSVQDDLLVEK